jgi:hypothetical protein
MREKGNVRFKERKWAWEGNLKFETKRNEIWKWEEIDKIVLSVLCWKIIGWCETKRWFHIDKSWTIAIF